MKLANKTSGALRQFVVAVTEAIEHENQKAGYPASLPDALKRLVADDNWLPDAFAQPEARSYCQYLLHCDPLERFSVVSFVWAAGQQTPIHDHTVWGAIGQLRGTERSTPYKRENGGQLVAGAPESTSPGDVIAFSPADGDIHQVVNPGPETAISIHVYGANIGRITRSVYDPLTGAASAFVSGYSNRVLPNLWEY
ncbi:MAG: cysteine dioxygenase [Pseudomonadota bacterium]